MISGRYAGWQAIKCFQQNDFSAAYMKQYDRQLYKKLWSTSRRSHLIQRYIFNKEWLFNGLSNILDKSRFIKKLVLKRIMKVAGGQ